VSVRESLRRLFDNWEKEIARPIVVSIATALVLFLASLSLSPVRQALFPPKVVPDYPVFCTAEPHVSSDHSKLMVDFFVVNTSGQEYAREDLVNLLRTHHPDSRAPVSPDIELAYSRTVAEQQVGRVEAAYGDKAFNRGKGTLVVEHSEREVFIRIENIAPRAVMKIVIVVAGLPALESPGADIGRTTKSAVPLAFRQYEQACYQR